MMGQEGRVERKVAVNPSLEAQLRHPCRRCFAYQRALPSLSFSVDWLNGVTQVKS